MLKEESVSAKLARDLITKIHEFHSKCADLFVTPSTHDQHGKCKHSLICLIENQPNQDLLSKARSHS